MLFAGVLKGDAAPAVVEIGARVFAQVEGQTGLQAGVVAFKA